MRARIGALVAAVAAAGVAGAARWAKGRNDADDEQELDVATPTRTAAVPEPVSDDGEGVAPVGQAAAENATDDLTAIKGLGKVKAAKLIGSGITSYAQIAAWTDEDIAEVGLQVNTSPGQIKREDWVGQAKALAEG